MVRSMAKGVSNIPALIQQINAETHQYKYIGVIIISKLYEIFVIHIFILRPINT